MEPDDSTAAKIDAIVGAAVRAMAATADDRTLGAFATSFRQQVSEVMGLAATPAVPPGPPDLIAMIKHAVQEVVDGSAPAASSRRRITVLVGGKKTSVTVPEPLARDFLAVRKTSARDDLNAMAAACPAGQKRSRWVEQQMHATLALIHAEAGHGVSTH